MLQVKPISYLTQAAFYTSRWTQTSNVVGHSCDSEAPRVLADPPCLQKIMKEMEQFFLKNVSLPWGTVFSSSVI